ncbi:MAG TPA: siderophore-interacting protein, partial [Ornithinimicrobium sp.]|uniref:siderophore-interacting protein n=1 Tax=Ornithinimicrobium sp. TaxID=1977084 RepID=UPI002CC4D9D8|nr:siderophore-interacting protein [Ornithinimicrobium sp.]
MSTYPRTMPTHPRMCRAEVLRTRRLSPSFQRVTIAGPNLTTFDDAGYDQWFRLFLPRRPGEALMLPDVAGREWWQSYLALPEQHRPHVSNYTVADLRRVSGSVEVDIDVVLHWDSTGHLVGTVARWAASAQTGDELALLDQGVL